MCVFKEKKILNKQHGGNSRLLCVVVVHETQTPVSPVYKTSVCVPASLENTGPKILLISIKLILTLFIWFFIIIIIIYFSYSFVGLVQYIFEMKYEYT